MTRRRIGIIGLGMAATPHAQSLLDLQERVEVAAAYSPTEARRKAFAEKFPFPLVETPGAIFGDGSIDAVMILTPPGTHLDLVRSAAKAGKHILLEKPLELTTARASELVHICRIANVRLGIVLQHRFKPAALKLKEALASGILGRVVSCSAAMRLWRPQSYYDEPGRGTRMRDGGGVLLTQGIHTLDLMLTLAGPVSEVRGYATTTFMHKMETEDLAVAALKFQNGAFGVIEATTTAYPGFPERIELACEKGGAVLTGTGLSIFRLDGQVIEVEPDRSPGGTGADPMDFPNDYHCALIADFLDAIEQKREPKANGTEVLRAHQLIDAILEAAALSRPVALRA
jgi:UDP-N-acetyl-2-amino-2-deoxyglucuronate dehydrogenase